MHPRPTVPTRTARVAVALALAALATGCSVGTTPAREVAVATVAQPAASVAAPVPSSSPSPSPSPSASPSPSPRPSEPAEAEPPSSPPSASPRPATGPAGSARPRAAFDVEAVQRRLAELRYYGGAVDGRSGPAMRSAVMAFQKVNGLAADGAVGPRTLAALAAPRTPVLRRSAPADRVEVDLDRQVLYVVEDGAIARIMPVSSGNGESYVQKDGSRARALTPVGTYTITRRIVGVRKADLGTLYDPQYFHEGWAIHGSNSVPAFPASHGCVRVTRADAKHLLDAIGVGTTVHLYGGQHVFSTGSRRAGTSSPTGDTAGPAT